MVAIGVVDIRQAQSLNFTQLKPIDDRINLY